MPNGARAFSAPPQTTGQIIGSRRASSLTPFRTRPWGGPTEQMATETTNGSRPTTAWPMRSGRMDATSADAARRSTRQRSPNASRSLMRIGLIGCGTISGTYLETLRQFPSTEVVACADLDPARARATAEAFAIPRTGSPDEVIEDDDI